MSDAPPVIRLVTAPEREAAADREHTEGAHAEAVRMLEEMLAFVRDNPDRHVTGLATAVAFSDRSGAGLLQQLALVPRRGARSSEAASMTAPRCMWCAIRDAVTKLYGALTCETCRAGGRQARVRSYLQRLRWAAESPRSP